MRRLLQRPSDGYYYSGPGQWTNDEQAAWNFAQTFVAINCALKERDRPIHSVLKREDGSVELSLPLTLPESQTSVARSESEA